MTAVSFPIRLRLTAYPQRLLHDPQRFGSHLICTSLKLTSQQAALCAPAGCVPNHEWMPIRSILDSTCRWKTQIKV